MSFTDTPLCVIIEYAAQGSLKHFLTLRKQNMMKLGKDGDHSDTGYYNVSKVTQPVTHYINTDTNWYMYEKQVSDSKSLVDYYNSRRMPESDNTDTLGRLSVLDIYYFLLQIAKGMDHIGKMKVSKHC